MPRELAARLEESLGQRRGLGCAQRPEIDGHERTAGGAGPPDVVEGIASIRDVMIRTVRQSAAASARLAKWSRVAWSA
jgi:hypothetical protein